MLSGRMTINGRKVIVEPIPEEEGGGFEAYLEGARWSCNGCGETEEEAIMDLISYVNEFYLKEETKKGEKTS